MLVVVHDWVGVDAEVEKLDGAITAGGEQLVLVDLGPCQVVQCVVCVEAEEDLSAIAAKNKKLVLVSKGGRERTSSLPGCQQPSDQAQTDGHCPRCQSWRPRPRPLGCHSKEST